MHWAFGLVPQANGCLARFAEFVCWQIFMPCRRQKLAPQAIELAPDFIANGGMRRAPLAWNRTMSLPSFPCKEVCWNFESSCASFFATLGAVRFAPSSRLTHFVVLQAFAPNCSEASRAPSRPLPNQPKFGSAPVILQSNRAQVDWL